MHVLPHCELGLGLGVCSPSVLTPFRGRRDCVPQWPG